MPYESYPITFWGVVGGLFAGAIPLVGLFFLVTSLGGSPRGRRFRRGAVETIEALGACAKVARAPLLLAIVLGLAFAVTAQPREVLVSMAENLDQYLAATPEDDWPIWEWLWSGAGLSMYSVPLLGIFLAMNAAWLLAQAEAERGLAPWAEAVVMGVTLLAFPVGVVIALLQAALGVDGAEVWLRLLSMIGHIALACVVIVLLFFIDPPDWWKSGDIPPQTMTKWYAAAILFIYPVVRPVLALVWLANQLHGAAQRDAAAGGKGIRVTVLGVIGGITALMLLSPVDFAQALGPFGVLLAIGFGLGGGLSYLSLIGQRRRFPIIGLLAAWLLALSLVDANDNHRVDTTMVARSAMPDDPAAAFEAWAAARSLAADDTVYMLAMQGGGLYAAQHAATVLARLYDIAPAVAERVFAVSAVSGGSVGLAVFDTVRASGLCADAATARPDEPGCYTTAVRAILENDFLSPVLARLAFADLPVKLAPNTLGAFEFASRARTLHAAFEDAIVDHLRGEVPDAAIARALERPALGHWQGDAAADVAPGPLMLINTTDAGTGARVVIAPLEDFRWRAPGEAQAARTLASALGCTASDDRACPSPTVLDAALVSARFPLVTPAGRFHARDGTKIRLVDGGYFENSGVETLRDLIDAIDASVGGQRPRFEIIVLDFAPLPDAAVSRPGWLGEVMSPIRALLGTRSARGELPKRRLEGEADVALRHASIRLDRARYAFPLGWYLSRRTADKIACHVWDAATCARLGVRIGAAAEGDVVALNHALLATLAGGE
jgi:hypothetical protein